MRVLYKYLFIGLYAALLLYTVFFARRRRNLEHRYLNIHPLNIVREFHALNYNDRRDVVNFYTNLAGNFILFIPYVFITIVLLRYKNIRKVLLSVFLLSLSIETIQYLFQIGVADIDDVLLNTAGGWAGIRAFGNFMV
jgi:glycopeptide antibiotics resistance protein